MKYHMRRHDKEIKDTAILRKIVSQTKYVTIAMAKDNQPYLVSLNHGYDPERNCIYFHCANEGKKLDFMKANNEVWGQALVDFGYDAKECTQSYATVMFRGKVSFIDDAEQKRKAFLIMNDQLKSSPKRLEKILKTDLSRTLVGRIDIDFMSGKKSKEVTIE